MRIVIIRGELDDTMALTSSRIKSTTESTAYHGLTEA